MLIFFTLSIFLSYARIAASLRDSAGESQTKMACLMAQAVSDIVDEKAASTLALFSKELLPAAQVTAPPDLSAKAEIPEVSIGDIQFDEKSNTWGLPLTVTMNDTTGNSVDICKTQIGIEGLARPLKDFKLGKTGNAALVDDKAYLVFTPGAKPYSNKFCSYNELQKAIESKTKWAIMDSVYDHHGLVFASLWPVKGASISKSNIKWWVFVVQDADRITEPLNRIILWMAVMGVFMTAIAIIEAISLGRVFTKPTMTLREGMDRLARGNLDAKVEMNVGGDMGRLADSFNEMVEKLKATTTPVEILEKEAVLHRGAEDKIKKMGSNFVSSLSRLKGLISGIRQGLKALIETMPAQVSEKQKEAINAENRSIEVMGHDIDILSDMAKIEAGKLELSMQALDIKEVIRASVFFFEPKIREKGLDMKVNIPKGRVDVYADADRIKQVLSILIDNAIKFTEAGSIDISVKEFPDDIEFSIADTGIGIAGEKIGKIFDAAAEQDTIKDPSKKGMGLGLAMSKAIIELHRGKLWVESEAGRGSRFTFRLPKHK